MTLTFRPARSSDIVALADLAARTFPLACPPELDGATIDRFVRQNLSESSFRAYLVEPGHTVLIGADCNGRLLAYALLADGVAMDESCAPVIVGRPTVGISKFYLDPDLHGTGGAGLLLDAVSRSARKSGAASLWLATNVANARARAFYVKHGFLERGHRVFEVGGVKNDDVVYERPL